MADNIEFISPSDRPVLLGISHPEWLPKAQASLNEAGFKVHVATSHEEFMNRYLRAQYQVIVLDQYFAARTPDENSSLKTLQRMPMSQRRHAVILLLGERFQSLNLMEAFQQSVHAVINPSELGSMKVIVERVIADNNQFMQIYRDTAMHVATQG